MTYNIQKLVFQKFIEGPKQFSGTNGIIQASGEETPKRHDDPTESYDEQKVELENIFDIDIPYYEANERYD